MATNKKPAKKYRRRHILRNSVEHVVVGLNPPSDALRTELLLHAHLSLQAVTHGTGTDDDWDQLTNVLNVSAVLAEGGVGGMYLEDLRQAQTAHAMCGKRKLAKGRFGYSGAELQQMKYAVDIHEAQLQAATVAHLEQALDEVERRLNLPGPTLYVNPSAQPSPGPWAGSSATGIAASAAR